MAKFTIETNLQEAELILKALSKLPFDEVAELFFNVKQQVESQLKQDGTA